jgi:hypothetical protein
VTAHPVEVNVEWEGQPARLAADVRDDQELSAL